jgi:hypothetical protein
MIAKQFPDELTPGQVLAQVGNALPEELRSNVIIAGSLSAGWNFFGGDAYASMRTKDVDVLLSPHALAVNAASEVTERLLAASWTQREDAKFGKAGKPEDPTEALPVVRLRPPVIDGEQAHWFMELLSAPPAYEANSSGKKHQRLHTSAGDFAIPSFDYLALAEWKPLPTKHGVLVARPEMMALANLLHHPTVGDALISGTDYKRSNKDLGRVLALAYLTLARDRRDQTDELDQWAVRMWDALREKFGTHARELAQRAGNGLIALLASPTDLNQALRIANLGLLASLDVGLPALEATGRRVRADVLDVLADLAAAGE